MESYQRYGPALLRKAERLLQSRDDALDVVQGLFTDLLADGGEEPEFPYLYRAVTNRCLGLLRDEKNRRRLLERQAPALRGPVRTTFDDVVVGLDVLARLLDRVDEPTSELLVMHFWDDMSQGEIAELTGVSRKTIVRRMARLREELDRILEPEGSR
ncbi:MAG: RNA polymerase sigma factor [Polyangiales bacterium]